ncbi:MAG: spore germination protein [Leptolyngbyaceae cyanobacterium SL_1_1]|nr:spore germination protein [Leptolyngbyaceae cyanobacterium RM2_2_21]NJO11591.1 spore germination protein [Leptolyngbyaceae cyanobacterium SL_1_1]
MEDKKGLRKIPIGIVAGLSAVVLIAGGATALLTWRSLSPKTAVPEFPSIDQPADNSPDQPLEPGATAPTAPRSPQTDTQTAAQPEITATGQVYWLEDEGTRFVLTPQALKLEAEQPKEQIQLAFEQLLAGPDASVSGASAIPAETELLGVEVASDGVHVDLSQDFTYGGGSAAMMGRLGQIIFTASSLDPETPVWISVAGEPLTLLGGEGLEVLQPMTRSQFEANYPL